MLTRNHNSYIPDHPLDYKTLFPSLHSLAKLDYHNLFCLDSSAVGSSEWTLIAQAIAQRQEDYDGFVVCHGTDTMVYSAAALGYAFGRTLNYPIVFTGAQRTPDTPNSDAESNLMAAIRLACSELAEVAIAFHNQGWRACRAVKVSNRENQAYSSPLTPPLAQLRDKIILHKDARRRMAKAPSNPSMRFSDRLCLFQAMPAHHSLLRWAQEPSWQVALLIGMGNANLPPAFIEFIAAAGEQSKSIIIAPPVVDASSISYPPLRTALAAGALLAAGYSLGGLWTKLSWLIGQSEEKGDGFQKRQDYLRQALNQSYIGEISPSKGHSASLNENS